MTSLKSCGEVSLGPAGFLFHSESLPATLVLPHEGSQRGQQNRKRSSAAAICTSRLTDLLEGTLEPHYSWGILQGEERD